MSGDAHDGSALLGVHVVRGPYHWWTRKKDGRTSTRILTDDQLTDYQPWFDNHRRLRELIAESRYPRPPLAWLEALRRCRR